MKFLNETLKETRCICGQITWERIVVTTIQNESKKKKERKIVLPKPPTI